MSGMIRVGVEQARYEGAREDKVQPVISDELDHDRKLRLERDRRMM